MRVMSEGFKLAYADFLLRSGLIGPRAALLSFDFLEKEEEADTAAAGDIPTFVRPSIPGVTVAEGVGE